MTTAQQEQEEHMTEQQRRQTPGRPYGSVRDAVTEWVAGFPEGKEFHYGDIAADLGVPLPTVSAVVVKLSRTAESGVVHGSKAGWYRKPAQRSAAPGGVLEVVGTLKDGSLLVRGATGALYRAEEL